MSSGRQSLHEHKRRNTPWGHRSCGLFSLVRQRCQGTAGLEGACTAGHATERRNGPGHLNQDLASSDAFCCTVYAVMLGCKVICVWAWILACNSSVKALRPCSYYRSIEGKQHQQSCIHIRLSTLADIIRVPMCSVKAMELLQTG